MTDLPGLTSAQAAMVDTWFPGAALVADHSWHLTGRAVLAIEHGDRHVVIKAGRPDDHHMDREITAHERVVGPLAAVRRAPTLLRANRSLRLLATTYVPGRLVEGGPEEWHPETYRQAGELLAVLHAQGSRRDPAYGAREDAKALRWLEGPHHIDPTVAHRLRSELSTPAVDTQPLVPCHGDWQPRNWVTDGGRVAVLDFGRSDWRPPATDLARLAAQQWHQSADLERAFFEGYGDDPRTPAPWRRIRLREAVGTAAWAHMVGDEEFEHQGHRMIEELLRR